MRNRENVWSRKTYDAIKVGYITDKVHLTSEQATKFWPVYNRYEEEMRDTRRSFMQKHAGSQNRDARRSDADNIDDNLDYQEAELNIRKSTRTSS